MIYISIDYFQEVYTIDWLSSNIDSLMKVTLRTLLD